MNFNSILHQFVLSLLGKWLDSGWKKGWIRFEGLPQAGWPAEMTEHFMTKSQKMMVRSDDLQNAVAEWQGPDFSLFWHHVAELSANGDVLAQRWETLDSQLLLHPEEIALLALMTAIHRDWSLLRALRFAMSEQDPGQPRWGFASKFIALGMNSNNADNILFPQNSALFKNGIIGFVNEHEPSYAAAELFIHPDIVNFLTNPDAVDNSRLSSLNYREADPSLKTAIKRLASAPKNTNIVIEGATGSGKIRVAQFVAGRLKYPGIRILDLTPDISFDQALHSIQKASALAVLHHDIIVLKNVTKWCDRWGEGILLIADKLDKIQTTIIWLVTGDKPSFIHVLPECHIRVPMPNRSAREAIWKELVADKLSPHWLNQLAGQFLLTRGQIEDALKIALVSDFKDEEDFYKSVSASARMLSIEGLGSLATPEPARVTRDQLIVSPECSTALEDLLMYAKHRHKLAKEWGFERSMPYGLGLAALFCGPPGTGKTFGAQIIATELQLELYRVDLSQLVSKYIGETEKHLAELFNAAEQGEILLLFDEADSIFSKRTEVKTSVDRYANLEINYLLQRLERFSGVSILTSNFESGIDEAFMRRIRFKVPFELPEPESRAILWEKFLSPAIPRTADVNIKVLADLFELSGGHIKEIVLRAASIAYGSEDKRVSQELLMRSAELEYKKIGKLLPYHS